VNEWGADFIAFSGHKMLGPTGIGILYGKRDQLESMPPFLGGGSMINGGTTAGFTPGELPAKFEAGTPPIAEAIGLAAAAEYLAQIGLESIAEHERKLGRLLRNEIAAIDGAQFLSANVEPESGIIAFHFHDLSAQDVALLLDRKGVAVRAGHHCAMPLHDAKKIPASLRASLYLYNTSEEVEQFGEHLKTVVAKLRA
jgi:cysteine desulfurase/selenocysteine lyase